MATSSTFHERAEIGRRFFDSVGSFRSRVVCKFRKIIVRSDDERGNVKVIYYLQISNRFLTLKTM